jgi:hypothetical protein
MVKKFFLDNAAFEGILMQVSVNADDLSSKKIQSAVSLSAAQTKRYCGICAHDYVTAYVTYVLLGLVKLGKFVMW